MVKFNVFLKKLLYNKKIHKVWTTCTSSLSLVQNWVRLRKTCKKIHYPSTRCRIHKCTTFLCQTQFDLVLTPSFFFIECFHCCYIYFHYSYMYNYCNYLKPCASNVDFQHFIRRRHKNFHTLWTSLKEGIGGESRPKDMVKVILLQGKL